MFFFFVIRFHLHKRFVEPAGASSPRGAWVVPAPVAWGRRRGPLRCWGRCCTPCRAACAARLGAGGSSPASSWHLPSACGRPALPWATAWATALSSGRMIWLACPGSSPFSSPATSLALWVSPVSAGAGRVTAPCVSLGRGLSSSRAAPVSLGCCRRSSSLPCAAFRVTSSSARSPPPSLAASRVSSPVTAPSSCLARCRWLYKSRSKCGVRWDVC